MHICIVIDNSQLITKNSVEHTEKKDHFFGIGCKVTRKIEVLNPFVFTLTKIVINRVKVFKTSVSDCCYIRFQ